MDHTAADDSALVAAAKAGDLDAFEALVRRHTGVVYAHAVRFFGHESSADDIVQEVFIKVYRSLGSFDERARFSTWLYRITRNTCLDEVRGGRRRAVPIDPLDVAASVPDDFTDAAALSDAVDAAMRSLPPEDRDALAAVGLYELSYAEAAEALGVPVGTVKSRVFRARRSLAVILGRPQRGGA